MSGSVIVRSSEQVPAELLRARIGLLATRAIPSPALAEAVRHHLAGSGKLLRGSIALDAAARLQLPRTTALALGACAELLHDASLVHDDVQDMDLTRRGQPSLWAAYGAATSICVGDHLIAAAYAALLEVEATAPLARLVALASAAITVSAAGQCAELTRSDEPCASLDAYREVAATKSGPLFALPAQLVFAVAKDERAIAAAADIGRDFAVAYQIADDLADATRDARGVDVPRAPLNILPLLRTRPATSDAMARRQASELALAHLAAACAGACRLPAGTGARFEQIAAALATELARA